MTFFFPWLLFACSFCIVPIILHLISYNNKKNVSYLSTFRFFSNPQSIQKKKIELKEILLMLIRMLLIIAIVLFFAHPYQPIKQNKQFQKEIILLIDDTASMHKKNNKQIIIEKTKQKIAELTKGYSLKEIQIGVLFSPSTNLNVTFLENINSLYSLIQKKEKSYFTANHSDALAIAISSFQKDKEKILVVVSDFQQNNWQLNRSYQVDKKLKIEWLDIAKEKVFENNLLIESVNVILQSNVVEVSIQNNSTQNHHGKILFQKESLPFFVEAQKKTNVFLKYQQEKIKNKISLDIDDEYSLDNDYYFSLKFPKKIDIGLIGDINSEAMQRDFFLINNLLKTGNKNIPIQLKRIDIKKIKDNFAWQEQIYFFLSGSEKLSTKQFSSLEEKSNNNFFFLFPFIGSQKRWQKLLLKISDANIIDIKIKQKKTGNFNIDSFNEQNDLTKIFINEEGDVYQFEVNEYYQLDLPKDAISLLSVADDSFFSFYDFLPNNRVYISSSSLDNDAGDFSFSYTFIILMNRIIKNYFEQQNFIVNQDCQISVLSLDNSEEENYFSSPRVYSLNEKIYQVNVSRKESQQKKIMINELEKKYFNKQNFKKQIIKKDNKQFKSYRFHIVIFILALLLLEFLLSDIWQRRKKIG